MAALLCVVSEGIWAQRLIYAKGAVDPVIPVADVNADPTNSADQFRGSFTVARGAVMVIEYASFIRGRSGYLCISWDIVAGPRRYLTRSDPQVRACQGEWQFADLRRDVDRPVPNSVRTYEFADVRDARENASFPRPVWESHQLGNQARRFIAWASRRNSLPGQTGASASPAPCGPASAERYVPLFSLYSNQRGDNFATTDPEWRGSYSGEIKGGPDYTYFREEGRIFRTGANPAGTVPLRLWWSESRGDNFATTDPIWSNIERQYPPDYQFVKVLGFVFDPEQPQPPGAIPLYSLYSESREDNFLTTDPRWRGERRGQRIGSPDYIFVRLEGFVCSM